MIKENRHIRRYCREVRRLIPCSGEMKAEIIRKISDSVLSWMEENSDADYNTIVARFGKPHEVASAYVEELDASELIEKLRIRRKVITIIVSAACVALALWFVIIGIALVQNYRFSNGYIEIEEIQVVEESVQEE